MTHHKRAKGEKEGEGRGAVNFSIMLMSLLSSKAFCSVRHFDVCSGSQGHLEAETGSRARFIFTKVRLFLSPLVMNSPSNLI